MTKPRALQNGNTTPGPQELRLGHQQTALDALASAGGAADLEHVEVNDSRALQGCVDGVCWAQQINSCMG